MDPKQRRQRWLLGGLLGILALVVAFQFWPSAPTTSTPAQARTASAGGAQRPAGTRPAAAGKDGTMSLEVVNVEIGRLEETLPTPGRTGRDPFRYQARAAPPPDPSLRPARPPTTAAASAGDGDLSAVPPPPPPPPPITLKFIGLLTAERGVGRVAVLSDGKYVFYGREGDVIEGRYRVVKIGEESIQMEHVDGRGRQTIRLSGA